MKRHFSPRELFVLRNHIPDDPTGDIYVIWLDVSGAQHVVSESEIALAVDTYPNCGQWLDGSVTRTGAVVAPRVAGSVRTSIILRWTCERERGVVCCLPTQ